MSQGHRSLPKIRLLISSLKPATVSALNGASGWMVEFFEGTDTVTVPNKSRLTNK